jgi:hypothetical protein
MTVYEPSTLLTDVLLGALAAGLGWRLHRSPATTRPAVRWWSRTLVLTAVSAFVGGTYHGFAPNFPDALRATWWTVTLFIVSLLAAAMALSLLHEFVAPAGQRRWLVVIAFKLTAFGGAVFSHPQFVVVIIDYGLVLVLWAVAALWSRRPWRGWMLAGFGLSVAAAVIQQLHWAPATYFNHNDLYHVIQALAVVAFYRAGTGFTGPRP